MKVSELSTTIGRTTTEILEALNTDQKLGDFVLKKNIRMSDGDIENAVLTVPGAKAIKEYFDKLPAKVDKAEKPVKADKVEKPEKPVEKAEKNPMPKPKKPKKVEHDPNEVENVKITVLGNQVSGPEEKPKRKRRTKAEMEAAGDKPAPRKVSKAGSFAAGKGTPFYDFSKAKSGDLRTYALKAGLLAPEKIAVMDDEGVAELFCKDYIGIVNGDKVLIYKKTDLKQFL